MKHHIRVLGIDIAKRVSHVVGMDERGQIVLRKRFSRHALRLLLATLSPVRIGLEACGRAHDWARRFRAQGHEVQLMVPQFVKPHIKSNKTIRVMPKRKRRFHQVPKAMSCFHQEAGYMTASVPKCVSPFESPLTAQAGPYVPLAYG